MDSALKSELLQHYPAFRSMPEDLLREVLRQAIFATVSAGSVLFEDRRPCQAFPMLLKGTVRVSKLAPNGRELQLYRVHPGESCILTSSCLLGNAPYSARGIAETELSMVALPQALFNRLLERHEPFRNYVFSLFSERLTELMQLVEEVAFRKLDQRLAALLLAKGKTVHATHQALADELGSVREMISRLLKTFADQGLVSLGREQIEVLDSKALSRLAETSR
ncbi:MAG: Crp/Fnr family transcriptional regulator [Betaproteobacteria bacterium]|nr:Crp/Fnr family transcriptional regulator [Betaproteobacteria bacterium]